MVYVLLEGERERKKTYSASLLVVRGSAGGERCDREDWEL